MRAKGGDSLMGYREATICVMAICAAVLIGWAVFVRFGNDETGDTISALSLQASLSCWVVPYAFGVLGGHLFMPGMPLPSTTWWSVLLLVVVGIMVGAVGIWKRRLPFTKPQIIARAFGLMILGILCGHLFWPQ